VSNQLSTGITEKVIIVIKKVVPQSQLEAADLNHFIRKNAHFFAYLLLGIFISNSLFLTWLKVQGQPDCHLAAWSPGRVWLASWVFCLFYAVTDELHQHFVPGRGCQLRDVLLDSAGAAVGVLLYLFGAHILGRHKKAGLFEF
jgi:VanZ family protein